MFTFLHRILVYGYNGRTGNRGRTQKNSTKTSRESKTFFSTVCPKTADAFQRPKLTQVRRIERLEDVRQKKIPKELSYEEPQSLRMLQELLNIDSNTLERQLNVWKLSDDYQDNVLCGSYLYLGEIQNANEKLYYTLLSQYIEQYLPIIKTPTVMTSCKYFGIVYKRPKGLMFNIHDKGQVHNLLKKWPDKEIKVIIVTESGRILDCEDPADRGALGMGIPMSKLALYTALAGIKPHQCLPITLDVGTDNLSLLEDPSYVGIKQRRVRGNEYYEFIDEFMDACIQKFGPNTLFLKTSP
ncbi:unnamed protein product [Arctia plantaginis]|uniref:Malic enzyme N-terminal domain-containing protein n=1 Tax=Arctia plantaginis TaxID=874455 RepID=A0A8S0Z7X3_ARCPL|nr:unnamed protein product [Arctia plantaginis]